MVMYGVEIIKNQEVWLFHPHCVIHPCLTCINPYHVIHPCIINPYHVIHLCLINPYHVIHPDLICVTNAFLECSNRGMWQVPRTIVPGPSDILPFFSQLPILFPYGETYGFCGAHYKRESNFSYLDCYTPNYFERLWWSVWQVAMMGGSTGT